MTRLPLNALKTLEAAGRLASFTRAAEELHVTPGAVSRQIRTLEDMLGFPLFERSHREVRLSQAGQSYVEVLTDSFRQMERATRRLVDTHRQQTLHVHAAITFTLRWLVPRLASFHSLYPRQVIQLSTALPAPAALAASVDANIQIRSDAIVLAAAPQLCGFRLMDIDMVPVCAPALLEQGALTGRGEQLAQHTLLHSAARRQDWASWLRAAGLSAVDPSDGIFFESSSLAYQGAIEGLGIAMGMRALVEADLRSGRLVVPYDFVQPTDTGFYLVHSTAPDAMQALAPFRDWITGEAQRARSAAEGAGRAT